MMHPNYVQVKPNSKSHWLEKCFNQLLGIFQGKNAPNSQLPTSEMSTFASCFYISVNSTECQTNKLFEDVTLGSGKDLFSVTLRTNKGR